MGESWVPSDQFFGARLALVRQKMGWGNVKEAALACQLPQESWRSWERDNRQPRDFQSICEKIAARTGCDLFWLMTGRGYSDQRSGPVRPGDTSQDPRSDTRRYSPSELAAA
jgi:hypothetical protein